MEFCFIKHSRCADDGKEEKTVQLRKTGLLPRLCREKAGYNEFPTEESARQNLLKERLKRL